MLRGLMCFIVAVLALATVSEGNSKKSTSIYEVERSWGEAFHVRKHVLKNFLRKNCFLLFSQGGQNEYLKSK